MMNSTIMMKYVHPSSTLFVLTEILPRMMSLMYFKITVCVTMPYVLLTSRQKSLQANLKILTTLTILSTTMRLINHLLKELVTTRRHPQGMHNLNQQLWNTTPHAGRQCSKWWRITWESTLHLSMHSRKEIEISKRLPSFWKIWSQNMKGSMATV